MDDKLLKTFLAVANQGSFTGAAKELYLAQSAVSKHITQLEKELGVQLFFRDTRMVRLTQAGEQFYRDAADLLERMERSVAELRLGSGPSGRGRLRLGVFSVLSSEVVSMLRRFGAEHPSVDLSLDWFEFGELIRRLDDGDLDGVFTIGFELMDRPHLRSRRVARGRMYVLVGKQSPLAGQGQVRLSDLSQLTYYTMRPDVTPNGYANIMQFFGEQGFQPRVTHRQTSHESMMLQLQLHDDGYSFMGDFLYREHPGLVFLPLAEEDQPQGSAFDLVAAWHGRNENPCLRTLLEWMDHLKSE